MWFIDHQRVLCSEHYYSCDHCVIIKTINTKENMECIVCAYEIDSTERLPTVAVCGHNDMCSLCSLRIRALHRNHNCITCKRELEHVICSEKSGAKFEDFPMWGDSIGPEFVLDQKSQMFFPVQYYKEKVQKLWIHKCTVCSHTFRDMNMLRKHVSAEHNMHICAHCVENKHDFPAEQRMYTQKQYETHLREGDQDGSQGHPNCEFCKKRYYDSTALFVHLNKDHYNCHLCERNGIKFKYYKDYKHLEDHFRKAHMLCDDPACLAKKFIVFDNEIDMEVHNRKYHPTFTVKRASTIKLDFKVARNNTISNNRNGDEMVLKVDGDAAEEEGGNRTGRYEGGLGGRAANGEWQVELQPISADPRDINRNAHISLDNLAITTESGMPVEEFPSLQSSSGAGNTGGVITLTNKWVSMGTSSAHGIGGRKPKKNDFPALQPKKTLSAKLSANGAGSSASTVNSMQREYDSLGNSSAGPAGSRGAMVGSLGDWARVKVDNKKPSASRPVASQSQGSQSRTAGYYSVQMPEQHGATYEDSLAIALAESLTDAYNRPSKASPVITPATATANTPPPVPVPAPAPKVYAPPAPSSQEAYPTLSSTMSPTGPVVAPVSKTSKKKPHSNAQAGGWGDALTSMGMSVAVKAPPKKKLTVIKASSSNTSLDKLTVDTPTGASVPVSGVKASTPPGLPSWDNLKPIGKLSNDGNSDEWRAGTVVPPAPAVVVSTGMSAGGSTKDNTSGKSGGNNSKAGEKTIGSWVKMGGAGPDPNAVVVPAENPTNLKDFPSLGGKRTK